MDNSTILRAAISGLLASAAETGTALHRMITTTTATTPSESATIGRSRNRQTVAQPKRAAIKARNRKAHKMACKR